MTIIVRDRVSRKIVSEAERQGLNPLIALTIAEAESTMGTNLSADASSATGVFQFLSGTWNLEANRLGLRRVTRENRRTPNDPRLDEDDAIRAGVAHIKSNMEELGANPMGPAFTRNKSVSGDMTVAYLTHFLGTRGARELLSEDQATKTQE